MRNNFVATKGGRKMEYLISNFDYSNIEPLSCPGVYMPGSGCACHSGGTWNNCAACLQVAPPTPPSCNFFCSCVLPMPGGGFQGTH
jgi:hypothetical protein